MNGESSAGYALFKEKIKGVRERTGKDVESVIPDILEQLMKHYTELQKILPDDVAGTVLPDCDDYSTERIIRLERDRVLFYEKGTNKEIKSTTIPEYFGEILGKIKNAESKIWFLDSAYRTLLMWEDHFRPKEQKSN